MKTIGNILSVLAFATLFAVAPDAKAAQTVQVTMVGCDSGGECWIHISPSLTGTGCSQGGSQVRFSTASGPQAQWKTATSAFLAGKNLVVEPNIGSSTCSGGFPTALWLGMTN